jgi:hypothetical protein
MHTLFYLMLAGVLVLIVRLILLTGSKSRPVPKANAKWRKKKPEREIWVQVYDTDSLQEAQALQARLEEEELECLVYEQGRKDVHGNPLKGYGIAVPRTSVPRAQNIIVHMPS